MKERILIVDDEKDVREALGESLGREDYEIGMCGRGEEALALLLEKKYDLVLVDIRLEGRVSGMDLIRKTLALSPGPAVVVQSATPKKELEEILKKEGLLARVDRILEKPGDLRPDRLNDFIHQVLLKERG